MTASYRTVRDLVEQPERELAHGGLHRRPGPRGPGDRPAGDLTDMTDHLDAAAVRAVPCLAELTHDEAAAGARQLQVRSLAPGEVLFREGDPGDSVYVLVRGRGRGPRRRARRRARPGHPRPGHPHRGVRAPGRRAPPAERGRDRTEAELWELTRDRFESALNAGEIWATRFLQATARELARRMIAVDQELVALMEEGRHHPEPVARVRELEKLRRKLSGEWTF